MPHTQPCRACEDLRVFLARWKDVGQHPRHVKRSLPPGGAIRRTCSCALQLQAHVYCYVLIRTVATSPCALLGAHMHSSYMHWLPLCSLQLCLLQGNWLARNVAPGRRHQANREKTTISYEPWRMLKNLDQDKFDSSCLAVEFDSRQLVNSSLIVVTCWNSCASILVTCQCRSSMIYW